MTITEERPLVAAEQRTKIGIIDTDVHPDVSGATAGVQARLPERWRRHIAEIGHTRPISVGGGRPRHREFASRWDAEPPDGGIPGSNVDFAREQLLDKYEMSGAMLNPLGFFSSGGKQQPADLSDAFCRAMNEHLQDEWLSRDPRWYGSLTLPYEHPDRAVAEVVRCKEQPGDMGDRWKQAILAPDNIRPAGHQAYWPLWEACEHYNIPIAFHVLAANRITPSGGANFYFEEHCDFALFNFPLISSMIFEGVFDRFPNLKVAMVELAWSWAAPLAWRLDHAHRVMGWEVSHLERQPSEYLRDHFWYTTQPMEEPEVEDHLPEVLDGFEATVGADKLMYSSDYPHWDFDDPYVLPATMPEDQLRRILGENARDLYGIPLLEGQGYDRVPGTR